MQYSEDLRSQGKEFSDRTQVQIETIEEMTGTMDPKSNFTLVILQTELERFKFLVRSYLRARIAKVSFFPFRLLIAVLLIVYRTDR